MLNNAVLLLDILDADVMTINWIKSETRMDSHGLELVREWSAIDATREWITMPMHVDAA